MMKNENEKIIKRNKCIKRKVIFSIADYIIEAKAGGWYHQTKSYAHIWKYSYPSCKEIE